MRYAADKKLEAEIVSEQDAMICIEILGEKALETFKNEPGKHCVQRVPPTESKGRRHTSMITVAIVPLLAASEVSLNMADIEIKTQGGHGPGGQHQNKTDSAVRAIHKPTGIQAFINGRSQLKNREQALRVIASRLKEMEETKVAGTAKNIRKQQIDEGGRSNKTRTYNFINSLVVDHNLGTKTGDIKGIMKGNFDLLLKK